MRSWPFVTQVFLSLVSTAPTDDISRSVLITAWAPVPTSSLSTSFITLEDVVIPPPLPPSLPNTNATTITNITSTPIGIETPGSGLPSSKWNALLAYLVRFPYMTTLLKNIGKSITRYEKKLAYAQHVMVTEPNRWNQNRTWCHEMTVVFARGTVEPGNVGFRTGPPLFDALREMVGDEKVRVWGVGYKARIKTFLEGGDWYGSLLMAHMLEDIRQTCPNTTLILGGYSQGAQLIHNSVNHLSNATLDSINSVVLFGDPNFGKLVPGIPEQKLRVFCHIKDDICKGGNRVLKDHLGYGRVAIDAAEFMATRAGFQILNGGGKGNETRV